MAILYFNSKKFDLAEKYLKIAVNSYDNSVKARAFTMLGEISLQKKEYPDAKGYFDNSLNITNVEVELQNRSLLGLGVACYYLNKYKVRGCES